MPQRGWPAHVGLSLLWGLSFTLARAVVGGFGWAPAAALCSIVVALGAAASALRSGRHLSMPADLRPLVVLGVAVAVQNLGLCLALDRLGLALTAIVVGAMPLFATLIGQIWGTDRITGTAAAGLAVGFVGLLLVVVFPAEGDSWAFISGMLACLMGALAAGFASRYAGLRLPARPEAVIGAHLFAAVVALPFALLVGQFGRASALDFVALALFSVLVATIGPVLDLRAPGAGAAERTNQVKTGGMLAAVLVGVVLLGEHLTVGQVFGALLLLAGGALVLGLVALRSPVGRR